MLWVYRGTARSRWRAVLVLLSFVVGGALSCSKKADKRPEQTVPAAARDKAGRAAGTGVASDAPSAVAGSERPCPPLAEVPSVVSAPARLVAIGDVHGDMAAAREVLTLAGAVDDNGDWIGGDLVVVQTGDVLDRGDDERAILDWLARLRGQARAAGGAVYTLNGNHELMNAAWDFRYVTEAGYGSFGDLAEAGEAASAHYGGPRQVWQLRGDTVEVLGR